MQWNGFVAVSEIPGGNQGSPLTSAPVLFWNFTQIQRCYYKMLYCYYFFSNKVFAVFCGKPVIIFTYQVLIKYLVLK